MPKSGVAASSEPMVESRMMGVATPSDTDPAIVLPLVAGTWAPLRSSLFRMFWIASLASNIGTWSHEVGSGWLMTSLDGSPAMVSAVRVAMSLPILLLAIPAGAIADRFDRRKLLLGVQSLLMATAGLLSWMTYQQTITPSWLITLTVVMGLGMVIHVPTWQASLPELVPREQISQAVALGSVSFNLARSIGPAVGGLLIASYGIWASFAVNACSFGLMIYALFRWKREPTNAVPLEPFLISIKTGVLFALRERIMRNVLLRVVLFVIPASALWSLMPLIAREHLGWDSRGYGYLVGSVGVGAVISSTWLAHLRRFVGLDQTIFASMCLFGAGLAMTSMSANRMIALGSMLVMGSGWMMTLTTLNSTAQVTLVNSLRARGMACYLSAMAGGMAIGSWTWGTIARDYSPSIALIASAALMPICAIVGTRLPLDPQPSRSGTSER